MEIKSDTSLKIKIGGLFIFVGLILLELLFGPPPAFAHIPQWLTLTTLLLLPVGYFLVLLRPALKRKKESDKLNNMYLMTYGQKIPLDLTKCDVTENSATTSVLVYKHNVDNKTEIFSTQSLPLDKHSLLLKLKDKKQTFVYVDNKDRNKYFFDMDFAHN